MAVAALVAQEQVFVLVESNDSIAVKGEVLGIVQSISFTQHGDSFLISGNILYIEDSGLLVAGIASKTGATCIVLELASVIGLVEQHNTVFGFTNKPLCTDSTSGAIAGDSVQRIT